MQFWGWVGLVVWYGTLLVSCLYGIVSVWVRTCFIKITVLKHNTGMMIPGHFGP